MRTSMYKCASVSERVSVAVCVCVCVYLMEFADAQPAAVAAPRARGCGGRRDAMVTSHPQMRTTANEVIKAGRRRRLIRQLGRGCRGRRPVTAKETRRHGDYIKPVSFLSGKSRWNTRLTDATCSAISQL